MGVHEKESSNDLLRHENVLLSFGSFFGTMDPLLWGRSSVPLPWGLVSVYRPDPPRSPSSWDSVFIGLLFGYPDTYLHIVSTPSWTFLIGIHVPFD